MSALGIGSSLPVLDASREPEAIRHGGRAAQNAYQTGLAFEKLLDSQLTQAMSSTLSGTGSSDDGLGGSTDDGSGLSGSGSGDPAASTYGSMLPDALTSGLMSGGGTGVAMQIARSIDPALDSGARS